MTKEIKSHWCCVECKSKQPKLGNINTPVRAPAECMSDFDVTDTDNVTIRRSHRKSTPASSPKSDESPAPFIRVGGPMVTGSVPVDRSDGGLAEFMAEMREFRREMAALRDSLTIRLDDFERRLGALEQDRRECGPECAADLERTVADLKQELNDRDQEALLVDLEIGELPEEKGVGVIQSVTVLAARLGVTLDQRDVVFAERVGPPAPRGGAPGTPPPARRATRCCACAPRPRRACWRPHLLQRAPHSLQSSAL
jgi:hypothetical protein